MNCFLPQDCLNALERNLRPELFKALCDPNRLVLLSRLILAREPLTVSEAGQCCGLHISGVSRHLSLLKRAGAVSSRKSGREVTYQVNSDEIVQTLRGLADAIEDCRQVAESGRERRVQRNQNGESHEVK